MPASPPTSPSSQVYFALVSYVPFPLGTFLDNLRKTLDHQSARAHITLLPPRSLRVSIDAASGHALGVLKRFEPFEVELDGLARFTSTDVLYLGLLQGEDEVHALHRILNSGDLSDDEHFEFMPHVTLGGPFPEPRLSVVERSARSVWERTHLCRRFQLDDVTALVGTPEPEGSMAWNRLWTYSLKSQALGQVAASTTSL